MRCGGAELSGLAADCSVYCLLSSLLLADDRLPVVTRDVVILDSVPEIRTTTGYIASTINL